MRPGTWLTLGWLTLLVAIGVITFGLFHDVSTCDCALTTLPEPTGWRTTPPEPDGVGFFVDGPAQDAFHPMWIDTHVGIWRLCPDETISLGGWLARGAARGPTATTHRAEDLSFRYVPAEDVWVVSAREGAGPRREVFVRAFRAEKRRHEYTVPASALILMIGLGFAIACLAYSLGLAHVRLRAARSRLQSTQYLGWGVYRAAESINASEIFAAARDAVRGLPRALAAACVLVMLACLVAALAGVGAA
jgi:hypothetical protein